MKKLGTKLLLILACTSFPVMGQINELQQKEDRENNSFLTGGEKFIVLAEGQAFSYVAEHIVIRQANLRMYESARIQCRNEGFIGKVQAVKGNGFCQAWYRNRVWHAMCSSEFFCLN